MPYDHERFKIGQRVRFTRGPLGAFDNHDPEMHLCDLDVQKGETGVITEPAKELADWLYVRADRDERLIVPVHPDMIEPVDEGRFSDEDKAALTQQTETLNKFMGKVLGS